MDFLKVTINGIKNIRNGVFEIPLTNSLNLVVGNNACGKSTLLLTMSQALLKKNFKGLRTEDYSDFSSVEIDIDGKKDLWTASSGWRLPHIYNAVNGMYEGSLFYGTRFDNSKIIDDLLHKKRINETDIVDADEYVKNELSRILHGVPNKYPNLKKIRNRTISQKFKLHNTPYFNSVSGNLISQYKMSSGECLLISLLHFIYNAIIRQSLPKDKLILILIDEIELALHPLAVSRFIDLLNNLIKDNLNLMIILSSHSPEVINKIKPQNIYKIENNNGNIEIINPAYPSYVIRDVYRHDGYDFLFLVEDELAKIIVNKIIDKMSLRTSKLIHVVPVAGWENTLRLQKELLANNVLGVNKTIVSILDGDVSDIVPSEYNDLKKFFLPIKSIEKYLYDILINGGDGKLKKIINDKYFTIKSLDDIISEFYEVCNDNTKNKDKKLYHRLKRDLESRNVSEEIFIEKFSDDIIKNVSFESFEKHLLNIVENS